MARPGDAISRVGIDTGGTFTDIVWLEDGRLGVAKVPSRPDAPAEAVMSALSKVPSMPALVCHGTTVGTNAILARHGGPARMVVTAGFRDVLRIGRGERANLYSPDPSRPKPLLDRDEIHEIKFRLDHKGGVLASPSNFETEELARSLLESGARAIAVGLLHSAQHPQEEHALSRKIAELTGLPVFASSDVAAYPREYERWTAASLAAYLAPVLGTYLADLTARCPARLSLMASSGGLVSADQAVGNPASCVLSGPAGGALAALSLGRQRVLALDMGGTSTDVTLLAGGLPRTREAEVDGLPLPLPTVDIHTIGAGGGSIVRIDTGGMLALGPDSAGADPGPACYGKGGPATLTDAALLAGRIFAPRFMGGEMSLDPAKSRNALDSVRGKHLTLDELIDGILELARVHLTGALRRISVARGTDPAASKPEFALVPFGGAGALFAAECAREMGIREVLHPRAAGVFSALGLIAAPIVVERECTILCRADDAPGPLVDAQKKLIVEIRRDLLAWDDNAATSFGSMIECRYVGQTHTLDIPLLEDVAPASLRQAFESAYKDRYTYLHPGAEVEIVALRVRGEIPAPSVEFPDIDISRDGAARDMEAAVVGSSRLRIDGRWLESPVYDRDALPIDAPVHGPALVVEDFATLYLPPDSMMHLDTKGHACIEVR